ncbi:hypothetical protein N1851_014014 [Merluccius polli]|uniref:Uncharacterized protein n=1 Tax=Merluccius polli TaxID=89951 RepID=A0AA47P361_MERPO|nr:hypothetical protein N1851_014014 [Merluccius polli]
MREIHEDDVAQQEQNRAQRESHIQLLLAEAREARELEASLRREENAQTAAFNQTFLSLLGQLPPPPLDVPSPLDLSCSPCSLLSSPVSPAPPPPPPPPPLPLLPPGEEHFLG